MRMIVMNRRAATVGTTTREVVAIRSGLVAGTTRGKAVVVIGIVVEMGTKVMMGRITAAVLLCNVDLTLLIVRHYLDYQFLMSNIVMVMFNVRAINDNHLIESLVKIEIGNG